MVLNTCMPGFAIGIGVVAHARQNTTKKVVVQRPKEARKHCYFLCDFAGGTLTDSPTPWLMRWIGGRGIAHLIEISSDSYRD